MKDIKHNRRDFYSVNWVMPQGSDSGSTVGGWVVQKDFFSKIQPDLVCELLTSMAHAIAQFLGPHPSGRGEGPKGQIS